MYTTLLKKLYQINLTNPVKMGLENMIKLNQLLGDPLKDIPIIHVTGTNGKGSVCLKISNYLIDSGLNTGLFTSPHISSFKERIQLNRNLLTDDDVTVCLYNFLFIIYISSNDIIKTK
jgi:dihydrofolate synthase/folylpolyglutamate synthase